MSISELRSSDGASNSDCGEVLYEIHNHATGGPLSRPRYPSEQVGGGSKMGALSRVFTKGVKLLKDKWIGNKKTRTLNEGRALFISFDGEHLAVASANQIEIFWKEDNYTNPCGRFTSSKNATIFIHGSWLEPQGILGLVDDIDTLYVIKANGEEISRTNLRKMTLSFPVIGMISLGNLTAGRPLSSCFCVVTTDGSCYYIEPNGKSNSSFVGSSFKLSSELMLNDQSPFLVACLDFYPAESLVAVVCNAIGQSGNLVNDYGLYSLCLWRLSKNLVFEFLFCSPALQGLFFARSDNPGPFVTAKVLISPNGKYVATLDLNGFFDVYVIRDSPYTLSLISFNNGDLEIDLKRRCLKNVMDFSWWSGCIVVLSMQNDVVTMVDVQKGQRILRKDQIIRNAILSRIAAREGHAFALEIINSVQYPDSSLSERETTDVLTVTNGAQESYLHAHPCADWSLISLSERSIAEMYELLIQRKQYKEALDFASRYHLDSDDTYKSQWLCSDRGVDDINTILRNIKDQEFVLSECVEKVGRTEDATLALLLHGLYITDRYKFSDLVDDGSSSTWKYRVARLQLLQCKDRLETFLGINMGRFSLKEYSKFRVSHISKTALSLAESGKIGALNLLFKRHPYSLASNTLHILGAIPETIPVHAYSQLLPGRYPPPAMTSRDEDWVESEKTVSFITKNSSMFEHLIDINTENLLKLSSGLVWPSVSELSFWYKDRAQEIDNLTGQLDNCLALVDLGFHKGIVELSRFLEDVRFLHQLTYSNDGEITNMMSILSWEQLPYYDKFKMMLKGVDEEKVLRRLLEKAVPFMHGQACSRVSDMDSKTDSKPSADSPNAASFLVSWLKEIATENKLDVCSAVVKEGCKGIRVNGLFKDEVEAVETALDCLYLCTLTDSWNVMASIISSLPQRTQKVKSLAGEDDLSSRHSNTGFGSPRSRNRSANLNTSMAMGYATRGSSVGDKNETQICLSDELDKRVITAEGHVEVGRLLAYYQVPKPMRFFPVAHLDEKNVKQLIRLIISKFSRQQGRADTDWANLWSDMQCLQEKAFSFLDKEYMLMEFCRGLLKAGKFSLARNYLKGSGNTFLAPDKAENLVIQAAREYFFSASSLSCSEIWKARECLNLFPDNDNVKAECGIIDALTKKLPNLGVTLLPLQYRQIGNPMEIITMVIRNQTRTYLDVDELIEIAKLIGLKSQDDVAAIQEAVAREAAVTGDLQLAFELCIGLAKKGHGPIWDLASAIAKGPNLDNMDTASRMQLLGFALSHCDDESLGELLNAWKDTNMQNHSENIMLMTGSTHLESLVQGSSSMQLHMKAIHEMDHLSTSVAGALYGSGEDDKLEYVKNIKEILHIIVKDGPSDCYAECDRILKENGHTSFFCRKLPFLFKLFMAEHSNEATPDVVDEKYCTSAARVQAGLCILSWLAAHNFVPSDSLIASLAKHSMGIPHNCVEDIIGSILLNLMDTFNGVNWIEEQLTSRRGFNEAHTVMNLGMMYSSLQSSAIECSNPSQRRKLLSCTFQERDRSFGADDVLKVDGVESRFWREWSSKLEEQKMLAEQARELERIIPGVDTARFLSGDIRFIEDVILSYVDLLKSEKKYVLTEAVKLADTYGLNRTKVLLRFLRWTLVSVLWTDAEILSEISDYKDDVVASAAEIISMIGSDVYPEVDGLNKHRISYIYSILCACCSYLKRTQESNFVPLVESARVHKLELFQFYKILEQQCRNISFIKDLNFKNIANLHDLSFEHFNEEIYKHVSASTVDALADVVHVLVSIYDDPQGKGLISRISVYRHHILNSLRDINSASKTKLLPMTSTNFIGFLNDIQNCYENCKVYIQALPEEETLSMLGKFCFVSIPDAPIGQHNDALGKDCLLDVLNFWIKVAEDIPRSAPVLVSNDKAFTSAPSKYLGAFSDLIVKDEVSLNQGWSTLSLHLKFSEYLTLDVSLFCKAMVLSGCGYEAIVDIISMSSSGQPCTEDIIQLYTSTTDFCLNGVISGSDDQQSLHKMLSSLSKLVYNELEDLYAVRQRIWEMLAAFSDNMQLSSHFRVYSLELMQSILGRKVHSFSDKLFSDVTPWEGWDDPVTQYGTPENTDAPCSLTRNLVALKSNQLLAAISPDLKVSIEDLSTVDSATSCFLSLSEAAVSEQHIETLQAILMEWEKLFIDKVDDNRSPELVDESNNWSGDEWGEGWEEEESTKEVKRDFPSVHPLHACWKETIRKLIEFSEASAVTKLMDRLLEKSQLVLLTKNEAQELLEALSGFKSILCLKIMLLLPYEDLWFQSLSALEDKLKQGDVIQKEAKEEYELLILILSAGLLPSIANDPSYAKLFSYLCYMIGHLSRQSQEALLKHGQNRSNNSASAAVLFSRLILPCFVSELVISGQYLLAGHIVIRWMHTHPSFRLINIVEIALEKYLEGLQKSLQSNKTKEERVVSCGPLEYTCTNLDRKLGNLLQTSLSSLPSIS